MSDEAKELSLIIGIPLLIVAALIWLSMRDARRWHQYADAHHCTEIARRREVIYQTHFFYDGKGQISGSYMMPVYSDRVTYRCDGGEVIER